MAQPEVASQLALDLRAETRKTKQALVRALREEKAAILGSIKNESRAPPLAPLVGYFGFLSD